MTDHKQESHLRSILKGITWRLIATTDTVIIALIILGSAKHALTIGAMEMVIKFIVYYFHERGWQAYLKGKAPKRMHLLGKTVTWRILATSTTFLISLLVISQSNMIGMNGNQALWIAIIESFTKSILYYVHELLWMKVPHGSVRKMIRK